MSELQDRVAFITASSRGIGAAIAGRFADHGATVAVHGADADQVAGVVGRIEAAGGQAMATHGDLTRFEDLEAARAAIEDRFGPVEILVANAGGSPIRPGPLELISEADWRDSVDANLTATFLTIKAFLPGMKARGRGNIITLSSAAARRPTGAAPIAYGAAKAGVQLLTQELALQAGPAGVRVNCIAPEIIFTDRNLEQIAPDIRDRLAEDHPFRRLGWPEDAADAALFLASDASAWITGVILDVAGGAVLT